MCHVRRLPLPGMAKTTLVAGALMALAPGVVSAQPIEKNDSTAYVAHVVFRPLFSSDVTHLGTATSLEDIPARCIAVERSVGDKDVLSSMCEVTDSAGDKVFSSFDTRDIDESQPKMVCGTDILTAGTGKYKGIDEHKPFACIAIPATAAPPVQSAMAVPTDTAPESKR